jgi:hypothetical protein
MRLAGWRSRTMLSPYEASAATERALAEPATAPGAHAVKVAAEDGRRQLSTTMAGAIRLSSTGCAATWRLAICPCTSTVGP